MGESKKNTEESSGGLQPDREQTEQTVEIKLDQNTLPKNGQKVEFELYHDIKLVGEYIEDEKLFVVSPREFYQAWIVLRWRPVKEKIKKFDQPDQINANAKWE